MDRSTIPSKRVEGSFSICNTSYLHVSPCFPLLQCKHEGTEAVGMWIEDDSRGRAKMGERNMIMGHIFDFIANIQKQMTLTKPWFS